MLLEAFTEMDKDACYTGINNGIFMGTLTGPDIRVESMRITAYTPNSYTKKKTMYVTATYTYVREAPNGTVITALGRGTEVTAGEAEYHSGIWYSITFVLTNGYDRSGWIAGIYLSETKPENTKKPAIIPKNSTVNTANVDAVLIERLQDMGAAYGLTSITLSDGYRSKETQQYFYDLYISGKGNPANRPGYSWHEYGGAVDVSQCILWDKTNAEFAKYSLCRPAAGEKWHIQRAELPTARTNPQEGAVYFNTIRRWGQ